MRVALAVAIVVGGVACHGRHHPISLTAIHSEHENAEAAGCDDQTSDSVTAECYSLLDVAPTLQLAATRKRWPTPADAAADHGLADRQLDAIAPVLDVDARHRPTFA